MSRIEIFLVVLFVLLSFVSSAVKKWKGHAATKLPPSADPDEQEDDLLSQDVAELYGVSSRLKMKNLAENENYFTFETVANNYDRITEGRNEFYAKTQPDNIQYIETEENTNLEIDLSVEELYKGIIYNEILQRPKYL